MPAHCPKCKALWQPTDAINLPSADTLAPHTPQLEPKGAPPWRPVTSTAPPVSEIHQGQRDQVPDLVVAGTEKQGVQNPVQGTQTPVLGWIPTDRHPPCHLEDSRLREAGAEVVYCLTRGAPKGPNLPRARLNHQDALFPGHGLATHSQTWIRGCAFHFAKAVNTKRDELGLRGFSNSNPLVHELRRRVRHLLFVPNDFRLDFAEDFIAARPSVAPLDSARLQQFAVCMSRFWLSSPTARDVWGQFRAGGPRTTNMVEVWNNGLHSRLSTYHPALSEFIQFLQVAQFASQNGSKPSWAPLGGGLGTTQQSASKE
ncbi:hypothetical protein ISCGN_009063 [Ixodes scapularis]